MAEEADPVMKEHREVRKTSLDYAWKAFEFNAQQRLTMFRFYLLLLGAAITGLSFAIQHDAHEVIRITLAVSAVFSAIMFLMDIRIFQFIKIDWNAMIEEEKYLAEHVGDHIKIMELAASSRPSPIISVTGLIRFFYLFIGLASLYFSICPETLTS